MSQSPDWQRTQIRIQEIASQNARQARGDARSVVRLVDSPSADLNSIRSWWAGRESNPKAFAAVLQTDASRKDSTVWMSGAGDGILRPEYQVLGRAHIPSRVKTGGRPNLHVTC